MVVENQTVHTEAGGYLLTLLLSWFCMQCQVPTRWEFFDLNMVVCLHISVLQNVEYLIPKVLESAFSWFVILLVKPSITIDVQGILVFASVMATLGLQIILESVRTLSSDVSG